VWWEPKNELIPVNFECYNRILEQTEFNIDIDTDYTMIEVPGKEIFPAKKLEEFVK